MLPDLSGRTSLHLLKLWCQYQPPVPSTFGWLSGSCLAQGSPSSGRSLCFQVGTLCFASSQCCVFLVLWVSGSALFNSQSVLPPSWHVGCGTEGPKRTHLALRKGGSFLCHLNGCTLTTGLLGIFCVPEPSTLQRLFSIWLLSPSDEEWGTHALSGSLSCCETW